MVNVHRLAMLVPAAVVLLGAARSATRSATPTIGRLTCEATIGQQVVERLNHVRAESGLRALTVDLRLVAAADRHTADMVASDFMAHEGTDGSEPGDRVRETGYVWRYVSENVAAGQLTAEWVVDAWMNSAGHRSNVLSARARHVGVGYGHGPGTTYKHYWTANFAATDGVADTPEGGCHP